MTARPGRLGLRAGDLVEVRTPAEIFATLDADGTLDHLPFMPEMLAYCGRRLRVAAAAHKTCDTINKTGIRRMREAVHLKGVRCNGAAHGGCQAACLVFWKEAWLRRVPDSSSREAADPDAARRVEHSLRVTSDEASSDSEDPGDDVRYVCQATELYRATEPLSWKDPRPYARDVLSGNVRLTTFLKVMATAAFNALQRKRGGRMYPYFPNAHGTQTPTAALDLQPGERVRIKDRDSIAATLDKESRNRGLWFDVEMVPYCGGHFEVEDRVERIIDERTGTMLEFKNPCILLRGVVCKGHFSRGRLLCPRAIPSYWREIWLERVAESHGEPGR